MDDVEFTWMDWAFIALVSIALGTVISMTVEIYRSSHTKASLENRNAACNARGGKAVRNYKGMLSCSR